MKVSARFRFDRNGPITTMALVFPFVRLSVCHTRFNMVQHIEIPFAPYDRAMLDARFLCS